MAVLVDMGPYFAPVEHHTLLRHVVGLCRGGVALEFGVGSGKSTRIIAERLPVIGFDSGLGLPEDWRPRFPAGSLSYGIPEVANATIIEGWFADTLPTFDFSDLDISLVHLDADLYSSTVTALNHVMPHLKPGAFLVFDEFHGYEGCENHEQRAFVECVKRRWNAIGHSTEAFALQLKD